MSHLHKKFNRKLILPVDMEEVVMIMIMEMIMTQNHRHVPQNHASDPDLFAAINKTIQIMNRAVVFASTKKRRKKNANVF